MRLGYRFWHKHMHTTSKMEGTAWPRLRTKTILGFKIATVSDLFLASELALILEFCGNGTLTRMRRAQGLNGMWMCVCVCGWPFLPGANSNKCRAGRVLAQEHVMWP